MPEQKGERKEGETEIDFGVGKLKLSGLVKGMNTLIDLASKLSESSEEIKRTGEINGLPKDAKGVWGFSIRSAVGGKPVVETFGNIKGSPRGPVVERVREPIADIFDETDHIEVIVELPGVEEKNIKVEIAGDILKLAAESESCKYAKEVLLPAKVKAEAMATIYRNGVLEVTLPKE